MMPVMLSILFIPMLSIEFYLFPSRCFHSDLVGCGCLFRAFAVLCRWRISLLGSWKMEHGCKRYIQLLRQPKQLVNMNQRWSIYIYIYIYTGVWKCCHRSGCVCCDWSVSQECSKHLNWWQHWTTLLVVMNKLFWQMRTLAKFDICAWRPEMER